MCTSAARKTWTDCDWHTKGARSAANSMIQRWSSSKAVLNTSFSSRLRKSRCRTEPSLIVIDDQVSSSSRPFSASSAAKCLLRTLNEPDSVLWVKLLAAIGSMPGEAPPQMIEMDAVGAIASLFEKRSMMPNSAASGQAPRSSASLREAASAAARICLKMRRFQTLAIALSKGMRLFCRNEWKPITPRPTERSRAAA